MRIILPLLLFILSLPYYVVAQGGISFSATPILSGDPDTYVKVSGTLVDTFSMSATVLSSVSLLRASDKVLLDYTRADESGRFSLKMPIQTHCILLISHPSYLTLREEILATNENVSMGNVYLLSRQHMLDEVVITDAKAIVIRGDTIEYNADSFKTRAYDNVNELLKKLPGLEVGMDGKIKAYGQEVKKMTVDGQEFFSDDPAVVAQTLRSSSVDKVQVFDKKSDQATFTGVDDGVRDKTINLTLKEEAKKGYFGKVGAGGGLPSYWENQAMINAFNKKRKISAYGIMSNTNTNGLGWGDENKFGGGGGDMIFNADDFSTREYDDDGMGSRGGQYRGSGVPKTWTGGAHYSNKWLNDTLTFNANYRYKNEVNESMFQSRYDYTLPDSQYVNMSQDNSTTIRQGHNVNTTTEYWLDTSSSVRVKIGGSINSTVNNGTNLDQSYGNNNTKINENSSSSNGKTNQEKINASLFYRKRFAKKGRNTSLDLSLANSNNRANTDRNSLITYYTIGVTQLVDQSRESESSNTNLKAKLTYTEPLTEHINLNLNYGINNAINKSVNNTFDNTKATPELDSMYSSHYDFNVLRNRGGVNINYQKGKWNMGLGADMSHVRFAQDNLFLNQKVNYGFFNVLPSFFLRYRKSQMASIGINYSTTTTEPSMTQIQPLRNNNNPLNVVIGNPDLKQTYSHNLRFNMNRYKVSSSENLYVSGSLRISENAIVDQQTINSLGQRTVKYINIDKNNFNANVYLGYGRKVIKGMYTNLYLGADYSKMHNYVNGLENINNNTSISPTLNIYYRVDTTLDLSYSFNPSYTINKSSISTFNSVNYWSYVQKLEGSLQLPLKFTIGTNITWNIRERLDANDKTNNVFQWNAYVSRAFLKDKSLVAILYAYDILNQNVGFNRFTTPTYVAENTYNIIQRYVMLSLTWNFTKQGTKAPAGDMMFIGE
jgi:hypothetical protein